MSFMLPDALYAYSALESNNLKVALTHLPAPLTAASLSPSIGVSDDQADPDPNTPFFEDGQYLRTSFDDWYYRIHIIPSTLALGNIAGDVQRTVVVWNAYFSPVELQDFELTSGQGLSYSSAITPPADIPTLEDVTYFINVSSSGPATITGEAVWTIDGVEYVVPISGQRSVLFGFRPDWKMQRVNETYEWLNTLNTSYSGYEQVMSIREEPRRILDYRLRLHDREARLFDESAFGWTGRLFGLPWWPDRSPLTSAALENSNIIYLDTTARSFGENGSALLYRNAFEYEILDVAEVHEDHLVLNNSLARDWPIGSHVYPVLSAIPQEDIATSRAASNHIDSAMRFTVSPTDAILNLPDEEAPQTYRGYEMYTKETNWRAPLGINLTARRKEVDGVLGPLTIRRKADFPLVMRGFSWMLKNRDQARELLAFFARRAGRRVPVWMPSGTDDFKLLEDIPSGQNAIRVERSEAGRLIGVNEARRDVVLVLRSGGRIARRILAVEDDGNESTVTFSEAFDDAISLSDVKRVSYLGLYRLASDTVTFAWATTSIAEVDVNLVLKKDRTT